MNITKDEIIAHAQQWFKCGEIGSIEERAKFHLHPHARLYFPDGEAMDLETHYKVHQAWKNEKHELGSFTVTPLNEKPPRVRVEGTFYFELPYRDSTEVIKAIAGFDWILQKNPDHQLKFVLYVLTSIHLLPDSDEIRLEK